MLAEALQLQPNTQSNWSSGSTVCFLPGRQRFTSCGVQLTMEPGSPVSDVSLDWCSWSWSITGLATGPTLHYATVPQWWQLTWSHIICLPGSIPLLAGPPPPDRHIVTGQSPGQAAGGEPWGGPAATSQYTVLPVLWINCLHPAEGAAVRILGVQLTVELGSPVSDVLLHAVIFKRRGSSMVVHLTMKQQT